MSARPLIYYEFFAGGGMARAGLGNRWACAFANDFDPAKAAAYADNWGGEHLQVGDVWTVEPASLPGHADLAWASSPCQDLSLAGLRAGLSGARSSAFWGFWKLIAALAAEGRAPSTLVIENVTGLLTSHGGADIAGLCEALQSLGYRFGALEIDAARFLPQSRPRLFLVAALTAAPELASPKPVGPFHSTRVVQAHASLPPHVRADWIWWRLAEPGRRNTELADFLEPDQAVAWHTPEQTRRVLALLGPVHQAKLAAVTASRERRVGTVFRRTRTEHDVRVQRAELRFDGVAGCLRTPGGGYSRQMVLVAEGARVRTRYMSGREGARLMGLPDGYRLPATTTSALHLIGDGVAAPVVRHLAEHLLEPLLGVRPLMAAE